MALTPRIAIDAMGGDVGVRMMLAGAAMARGGIADRLYGFCDTLVGHWRGGLAQIAVLNSVFMGAMSGSAGVLNRRLR